MIVFIVKGEDTKSECVRAHVCELHREQVWVWDTVFFLRSICGGL
jgi:hypothetical protein